jgi:predicted nucleic acid-binding protein
VQLADTSAWGWSRRRDQPALREWFDRRLIRGTIATCDMVRLELLRVARNHAEFTRRAGGLNRLPDFPITTFEWRRALFVYGELARQGGGHQRSVGYADLLIAAAAEGAGIPVLHYDEDFERIAEITGQPHRWIAPRGSLA